MTKLYGALFCSVLLFAACGEDPNPSDETAQSRPDSMPEVSRGVVAGDERIILFLGNSLSAGYGVRREEAFPSLIQERIDSLGWNFKVVNAGVSGDTSSGGLSRLDWLLRDTVDVLVVELGANDGLRGISPDAMRVNLAAIIDRTRARFPDAAIVLAGMRMPPNLGRDYTEAFERVYLDLAAEKDVHLIPFLLADVGGVAGLNQGDGIHPTAQGHEIIARTVWEHLEPVLAAMRSPSEAT